MSAYFRGQGGESAAMPFKARSDSLEEGKRGRIRSELYEAEYSYPRNCRSIPSLSRRVQGSSRYLAPENLDRAILFEGDVGYVSGRSSRSFGVNIRTTA